MYTNTATKLRGSAEARFFYPLIYSPNKISIVYVDEVQQIKDKIDVADLVGSTPTKPAG